MRKLKVMRAHHMDQMINCKMLLSANPCDVEKKHVSTSCDDLLDMPCSSHMDAYSSSVL
jgi:hypothetical protein